MIAHGDVCSDNLGLTDLATYSEVLALETGGSNEPEFKWPAQGACTLDSKVYLMCLHGFGKAVRKDGGPTLQRAVKTAVIDRNSRIRGQDALADWKPCKPKEFEKARADDLIGVGRVLRDIFRPDGTDAGNLNAAWDEGHHEAVNTAVQGTDPKVLLDAIASGRSLAAHFHKDNAQCPSQDPFWINLLDFWWSVDPMSGNPFKTAEELCRHPFIMQHIFSEQEIRQLLSADGMVVPGNAEYAWGRAGVQERLHTVTLRWGAFGVEVHAAEEIPEGGLALLYSGPHFVTGRQVEGRATSYSWDPFTRYGLPATNGESHVDASVTPAWPMTKYMDEHEPMLGGFANSSVGTGEAPNLTRPAYESWYGRYPCTEFSYAFAAPGCLHAIFAMRACSRIARNAKLRWDYMSTTCELRFRDRFTVRFDSDSPAS